MTPNETKLKIFGLLKATPDLDLLNIVHEFKVPMPTLRKWKKQFEDADTIEDLDKAISVDEVIITRVAAEVVEELAELVPEVELKREVQETLVIDEHTKEIVTESELSRRQDTRMYTNKKSAQVVKGLVGLDKLREDMQSTASIILDMISEQVSTSDVEFLSPRDIKDYSLSLSALQKAFFHNPTTNINVLNTADSSSAGLSNLRSRLKA